MGEQLQLSGELSITMVDQLVADLQRALQSSPSLTIDLNGVERIDTAAAQVLLAAQREALENGHPLVYRCPINLKNRLKAIGIQL